MDNALNILVTKLTHIQCYFLSYYSIIQHCFLGKFLYVELLRQKLCKILLPIHLQEIVLVNSLPMSRCFCLTVANLGTIAVKLVLCYIMPMWSYLIRFVWLAFSLILDGWFFVGWRCLFVGLVTEGVPWEFKHLLNTCQIILGYLTITQID